MKKDQEIFQERLNHHHDELRWLMILQDLFVFFFSDMLIRRLPFYLFSSAPLISAIMSFTACLEASA